MPRVAVIENVRSFGVTPHESNVVEMGSTGKFKEKPITKLESV
jgi:hypothetical protein